MTTNTPQPNVPGDEVDRLLSAYFRAQMPAKWPAAPAPGGLRRSARQEAIATDPTTKSRWALAASVGLLIGSCWYLSGAATNGHRRPDTNLNENTTANSKYAKDAGKEPPKGP